MANKNRRSRKGRGYCFQGYNKINENQACFLAERSKRSLSRKILLGGYDKYLLPMPGDMTMSIRTGISIAPSRFMKRIIESSLELIVLITGLVTAYMVVECASHYI